MTPAPILRCRGVGTSGLDGVDLAVAAGELVGVTGASETGKSTLLRRPPWR